tara:strand:- start:369 stop:686 length:318 start_codon:yes stop_codon:yes gene_type:complete
MYWFLLKSIMSSVLGSQFYKWYAQTKMGIYFQNRINQFMEYISQKYDIEIAKKQSKFEQDYPLMMKRVRKLERLSHPDRKEAFEKIMQDYEKRLNALEKKLKNKK